MKHSNIFIALDHFLLRLTPLQSSLEAHQLSPSAYSPFPPVLFVSAVFICRIGDYDGALVVSDGLGEAISLDGDFRGFDHCPALYCVCHLSIRGRPILF